MVTFIKNVIKAHLPLSERNGTTRRGQLTEANSQRLLCSSQCATSWENSPWPTCCGTTLHGIPLVPLFLLTTFSSKLFYPMHEKKLFLWLPALCNALMNNNRNQSYAELSHGEFLKKWVSLKSGWGFMARDNGFNNTHVLYEFIVTFIAVLLILELSCDLIPIYDGTALPCQEWAAQGLKGLLVASESIFYLSVALECPPATVVGSQQRDFLFLWYGKCMEAVG